MVSISIIISSAAGGAAANVAEELCTEENKLLVE